MKKKATYILSMLLIAGFAITQLSSCKPDDEPTPPPIIEKPFELVLQVKLMNGGEELELNRSFSDNQGHAAQFVAMQYYLSDIRLKNADGSFHNLSEVELFNHRKKDPDISTPQWENFKTFEVPDGRYEEIAFGLGIPEDLNQSDPTVFDNHHPLSTYSGMYWNWATMYRFVILEAKIDTTGGNNLEHDLIFHTGTDELYRTGLDFEIDLNASPFKTDTVTLQIDWNKLFHDGVDPIDLRTQHLTHTTDNPEEFELAERFTENMVHAITLK